MSVELHMGVEPLMGAEFVCLFAIRMIPNILQSSIYTKQVLSGLHVHVYKLQRDNHEPNAVLTAVLTTAPTGQKQLCSAAYKTSRSRLCCTELVQLRLTHAAGAPVRAIALRNVRGHRNTSGTRIVSPSTHRHVRHARHPRISPCTLCTPRHPRLAMRTRHHV